MRSCAAAVAFVLVLASGHVPAWAQAGWYLTPSLSFTESFDDNINGTVSNKQSDFISRFSPGLQAGYQSDPFTLLFNGGFDSEIFAKNPQNNDATSGWRLGVSSTYVPIRLLTLGFNLFYAETRSLTTLSQQLVDQARANPNQPNPANTLQSGRQKNTVLTASPSATYRFDSLTTASAAYAFTYAAQEGGDTNTAHQFPLSLSRQITPLDTATINYRLDVFDSTGLGATSGTQVSQALTFGWTRQFTLGTSASLAVGPRFSEGEVKPEVNASLNHQFKLFDQEGQASLSYARSEGFAFGVAGVQNTQTFTGSVAFEPLRSLQVNLGANVTRLSGSTTGVADTTTYGVTAAANYQILRWLSAFVNYSYSLQVEDTGDIHHNVFSIGLTASYPTRID